MEIFRGLAFSCYSILTVGVLWISIFLCCIAYRDRSAGPISLHSCKLVYQSGHDFGTAIITFLNHILPLKCFSIHSGYLDTQAPCDIGLQISERKFLLQGKTTLSVQLYFLGNSTQIWKLSYSEVTNKFRYAGRKLRRILPKAILETGLVYTRCNRRNGSDFGRVFLRSNYTDITQNTYIQCWTVTEILAREKSGILLCLRTVLVSVTSFSPLLELHSYVRANVAPAT